MMCIIITLLQFKEIKSISEKIRTTNLREDIFSLLELFYRVRGGGPSVRPQSPSVLCH